MQNEADDVKLDIEKEKEKEKANGIAVLANGHVKPAKKESMASRAAHIVAVAAACNGDLDKLNGLPNGKVEEKEDKTEEEEEGEKEETSEKKEDEQRATSSTGKKCVPVSTTPTEFMCDWDCCSQHYFSPSHVVKHLSEEHVVEELRLLCRWNGCMDPTPRNRWSLITHIQDTHCSEAQLKAAAAKRKEGGVVVGAGRGLASGRSEVHARDLTNHPGYAKNAAFDAIRRHAFNFLARELTDEAEGPVTKSIRLTSCLILRNLARYSADGRQ